MPYRNERHPILPGAEAWSSPAGPGNAGPRGRLGVGLIHGFSGNPVSLRPLAEQLAALGFAVALPRLPGHGTHPLDLHRTNYADWRAAVLATIDTLRANHEQVALIGLSMGGSLILDIASSGDRALFGLVCINPQVLDREGVLVPLAPLVARLLPLVPAAFAGLRRDDIAKSGVSECAYGWLSPAAGLSFARELSRIRGLLSQLTCPLLVAHSRSDHCVPPANSEALLKLVPHARELVLDRSHHIAPLDHDQHLLVAQIATFLDELLGN